MSPAKQAEIADMDSERRHPIRILHLEDNPRDAELVQDKLEVDGLVCEIVRVENRDQYESALARDSYDIILCDYNVLDYDGLSALKLAREIRPATPVVIFSGSLGEEQAVESLTSGATDYVLKDRPERLTTAVRRALHEAKLKSERLQVEEGKAQLAREVELQRNWLNHIISTVPGIVWEAWGEPDAATQRVHFISEHVESLTGYTVREWLSTPNFWLKILHPEDREEAARGAKAIYESKTGGSLQFRWLTKGGKILRVESKVVVVLDENGAPAGMRGVTVDTTEHKRIEQRNMELAALLEKTQDAIYVRDLEQRITYWNRGAEKLYGWTREEAINQRAADLLYKEQSAELEGMRQAVLEKGEWKGELHQVTKSGHGVIVQARRTLLRNEQGEPDSILNINTDITEKKSLESQFLRAQRLESIGTLAGGVAHDLNNVLAPIMMGTQLLRLKFSDESSLKLIGSIESSAQRGADIVKQILSFARGLEGQHAIIEIKYLIADQVRICKQTFPPEIQVQKNVAVELWPVLADATQLSQILMNFCINARDAMPNGGTLSIGAENVFLDDHFSQAHAQAKPGPYTLITVRDTGTGISPQFLDKIFDPFFTTKAPGKGTGLGLSTVFGIVKNHHGFVTVHSEEGRGAEFKVYLPAARKQEVPAAPEPQPNWCVGQGELVLVVDDEESIREITKGTLEVNGYRVLTACDGTEALATYAQCGNEIQLVITDLSMPWLDGAGTIRALQKMNPEAKIIAASGLSADHIKAGDMAGKKNVTLLRKPFTAETLLKLMRDILS